MYMDQVKPTRLLSAIYNKWEHLCKLMDLGCKMKGLGTKKILFIIGIILRNRLALNSAKIFNMWDLPEFRKKSMKILARNNMF